jgi:hypothetical protein
VRLLKQELDDDGVRSKQRVSASGHESGGKSFSCGALYKLLSNPIYVGEIRHGRLRFPGQHEAIVERELWDKVQKLLSQQATHPRGQTTTRMPNLLTRKLFDEAGEPLYVTGTTKGRRYYRYYVSRLATSPAKETNDSWRIAAPEIERAVIAAAAQSLQDQATLATLLDDEVGLSAQQIRSALKGIVSWRTRLNAEPAAQAAAAQLIELVELADSELRLTLNLAPVLHELGIGTILSIQKAVPMQLRRRGVESPSSCKVRPLRRR